MTKCVGRHYYNPRSSVWETDEEIVSSCGKISKNFTIFIKPLVKEKIDLLMQEYPETEWLAYFLGNVNFENEQAVLEDIIIPKDQTVTTASVDDIERDDVETVGVVHSHHKMKGGFSKTDWDYINQNNTISIVIFNNGKELEASVKVNTPCGAISFINDPKVKFVTDCNFDKEAFIKDAKAKIKEFDYTYGYGYGYNYGRRIFPPQNNHRREFEKDEFDAIQREILGLYEDADWNETDLRDEPIDPVEQGYVEIYDPKTGDVEYYYPNSQLPS